MHALLLLLTTVVDPELGAEQSLDTPRIVRSAGLEASPAIAPIPGGAIVVFRSDRRGQPDLWMTQVSEDGAVRTPAHRVSDSDDLNATIPHSVACVGERCVVAWQVGDFPKGDVYFRRFTLDGTSLDPGDRILSAQPHHEGAPQLIATPTGFIALFSVVRGAGYELVTTRISLEGNLSNQVGMGQGGSARLRPSRSGFELGCVDQLGRVVLRRFSPMLEEQEQQVLATPQNPLESFDSVDLVVSGDRLLAAWTKVQARPGLGSEFEVFGWLDGSAAPFLITGKPDMALAPSIAVDGAQLRVTMMSRGAGTIVSRLVDPTTAALSPLSTLSSRRLPVPAELTSTVLGSSVLIAFDVFEHGANTIDAVMLSSGTPRPLLLVPAGNSQRQLALTAFGSGFLGVWQDTQNLEQHADDLFAARLDADGRLVGAPFPVAVDPVFQGFASVAATPSMALVAWYDERGNGPSIRAARIDAMGKVLDSTPLVIAEDTTAPVNSFSFPAVATDGSSFLVLFSDQRDDTLRVARVGVDGVVSVAKVVREGSGTADLAFGGGHYMVVSTDEDVNTSKFEVWVTVLDVDGAVLTPAKRVVTGEGLRSFPRIAFDTSSFLAVWTDGRRTTPSRVESDVRALALNAVGQPLGEPFDISVGGAEQEPSIAFDGESFQVTWFSFDAPLTTAVRRAVVSRSAVLSTTTVSALPRVRQVLPRIAFNAEKGLIAFERFEAGPEAQRLVVRTSATSKTPSATQLPAPVGPPPPLGLPPFFACRCAASPASALLGVLVLVLASRKRSR